MKRLAILVVLLGCSNHHAPRWFSKNGKDCAMVRFNESMGEWEVFNQIDTAIFPEEKDALVFARNVCGGGEITVTNLQ